MHWLGLGLNRTNNNDSNNHILVVSNEYDVIDVIRFCLRMYSYQACTFTDPLLALDHFKSNSKSHHIVISTDEWLWIYYTSKENQSRSKSGAYDFFHPPKVTNLALEIVARRDQFNDNGRE